MLKIVSQDENEIVIDEFTQGRIVNRITIMQNGIYDTGFILRTEKSCLIQPVNNTQLNFRRATAEG